VDLDIHVRVDDDPVDEEADESLPRRKICRVE
jgi:hypothetical protein